MDLEDFDFEYFVEKCKDYPELIQNLIEIWEAN